MREGPPEWELASAVSREGMAEGAVDVGAEGGEDAAAPDFRPPATPPPVPADVAAAVAAGGMPGMDPLSRVGTPSRERKELWELLNLPEVRSLCGCMRACVRACACGACCITVLAR